jgi:hypothetical protein
MAEVQNKNHNQAAEIAALKCRLLSVRDRKHKKRVTWNKQKTLEVDSDYSSSGGSASSPRTAKKKKHKRQRGGSTSSTSNIQVTYSRLMCEVHAQRTQASAERRWTQAHEETVRKYQMAQEAAERRVSAEQALDKTLSRLQSQCRRLK